MKFDRLALNLRYLLWRREEPRQDWARSLHAHLPRWSVERVRAVLSDGTQDYRELQELAGALGITEEDLTHADLLAESTVYVLRENLCYLAASLARGGKSELAMFLGKDATTISRWLRGDSRPSTDALAQLLDFFGLPARIDLNSQPVFLNMEPISAIERREWLHRQIDTMSGEEIRDLFPALKRIFGGPK